jgi:DNA-binding transcriptional LysR family regulator
MRGLSPDQLRALAEVVELGSFTAAARKLNLTQPAVSLQIRNLEERLGVPLVERLGKRAYATAPGRQLIEHAQRMAQETEAALASMRRYREGWLGRVRIGTGVSALIYRLPPILQRLRGQHPDIELAITIDTSAGVAERVLANAIDIGFVTLPVAHRELEVVALIEEQLLAVFPPDATDVPPVVTPDYVASRGLIVEAPRGAVRQITMDWLGARGATASTVMELDNTEAIKCVVALGLGIAILPSSAVSGASAGTVARPLKPALTRTLGVVHRRDKRDDAAFAIVRAALLTLGDRTNGKRPKVTPG